MPTTVIPLSECEAEIGTVKGFDGKMLWFYYEGHHHGVPFHEQKRNHRRLGNVWQWVSGTTIHDLTLSPSYHVKAPHPAALHAFIRDGKLEVL